MKEDYGKSTSDARTVGGAVLVITVRSMVRAVRQVVFVTVSIGTIEIGVPVSVTRSYGQDGKRRSEQGENEVVGTLCRVDARNRVGTVDTSIRSR